MGITPITSLLPLTLTRTTAPDLEPLPMARVEDSPRMEDETYSHGGNQQAGNPSDDDGLEDDVNDVEFEQAPRPARFTGAVAADGSVNFVV